MVTARTDIIDFIKIFEIDTQTTPYCEIANVINNRLFEPMQAYAPLTPTDPFNPESDESSFLTVTEISVSKALKSLNPRKATGSDCIPSWLLREYAGILAYPISNSDYLIFGKKLLLLQYLNQNRSRMYVSTFDPSLLPQLYPN